MINIAIVDDKRLNRINRSQELEYSGKLKVLFTSQNGEDFLEQMKAQSRNVLPDIVLMDIDMPIKNGIETVRHAKQIYPCIEFLMLTVFDEDEKIFEAIKAGASGYMLKDESSEAILSYIEQVKEFKTVPMSPSVARKALRLLSQTNSQSNKPNISTGLSDREIEVLRELVNGLDFREIAEKLFVSPNTVRNHISNIYQKLHVTCKVDAVKIAIKNDIV